VVLVTADGVTLGNGGFTIVSGVGASISPLIYIVGEVDGTTVQNNVLDASSNEYGILVGDNALTATSVSVSVLRNSITGASKAGIRVEPGNTNLTASNNFINGSPKGIELYLGVGAVVKNNDLSGTVAINNAGPKVVDASGNWWGTTVEHDIHVVLNVGPVDFTPYLNVGTDTAPATPGFQGDFSTLHVSEMGAQTGPTGRVQEGVNLVTASTVIVHPGTYLEAVSIGKSLTLKSTGGAGVTTINSAGLGSSATIKVTAGGVTIGGAGAGFTLSGSPIGVLATGSPGLTLLDNIIEPVGSTGVDATGSPGTTVAGGHISISSPNVSTGVLLKSSGGSAVIGVDIKVTATLSSTGVWLVESPGSTVDGVAAVVTTLEDGFGVRVRLSGGTVVKNSTVEVHAGKNGNGVVLNGSPNSTVQGNAIHVEAGASGTGIVVTDSANAVIKDNGGLGLGLGAAHAGPGVGVVVFAQGNATGARLANSPGSQVRSSFFDVFTELSFADGVVANGSGNSSFTGLEVKVRGKAGATGAQVMNSPGSSLKSSVIDTEMLSMDLSGGPGVLLDASGGSSISDTHVRLKARDGVGIQVNNCPGCSLVDSFFDVFAELSATGAEVQNSPDAMIAGSEFLVHGGVSAFGVRLVNSPRAAVADSTLQILAAAVIPLDVPPPLPIPPPPPPPVPPAGAWGVQVLGSADAVVSGNDIDVKSPVFAVGVNVNNKGLAPAGAPVLVELNDIDVLGGPVARGVALMNAGGSAVEGNDITVGASEDGEGVVVDDSPGVQIAPSPDGGPTNRIKVCIGHPAFLEICFTIALGEELAALDGMGEGVGVVIDGSPGTVVSGAEVEVLGPVDGIGILALASSNVAVTDTMVHVTALMTATGVVVGDHSDNFRMSNSTVDVAAGAEATGVWVTDSDGATIGPGNAIRAVAEATEGEPGVSERGAVGVALDSSQGSAVVGNAPVIAAALTSTAPIGITAIARTDGGAFAAFSGGVLGFEVGGLHVDGNAITADAGGELAAFVDAAGAAGPLKALFDKVQSASTEGEVQVAGFTGGVADAAGILLSQAKGASIDDNQLNVMAHLAPAMSVSPIFSEAVAFAAGIGVSQAEKAVITNNEGSVMADAAVDLMAVHGAVESMHSIILNGFGLSEADGILVAFSPETTIANNNLDVQADTALEAVISGDVTSTAATLEVQAPDVFQAAHRVALNGADGRGVPVGAFGENKFANAEGWAFAIGIGLFLSPQSVIDANTLGVGATVDVSAEAVSGLPPVFSDTEAFALGHAEALGISVVASDLTTISGNSLGVLAQGTVAGAAAGALPAPTPIMGPFALADVSSDATGIVVLFSKKVKVVGNGVDARSNGIAFGIGVEGVPLGPLLAEGWAFGTSDAAGIVGEVVDRILVQGNTVHVAAHGAIGGIAFQVPLSLAEAVASAWNMTEGIAIAVSEEPVVNGNTVAVEGKVVMDVFAESLGGDAALAAGLVDAEGIHVVAASMPKVTNNSVGVLGVGELLPRMAGAEFVEEVRQCHIEVFATGIRIFGSFKADVVGNNLGDGGNSVTAVANCETPFGEGGVEGPKVAHPEVVGVTDANAAGIWIGGVPGSHVNDNSVMSSALATNITRAIPTPPPGTMGPDVIALSASRSVSRGITVRNSPDTEIARNGVDSAPVLSIIAIAADSDTLPVFLSGGQQDDLLRRGADILFHGGHDIASASGFAFGQGIGVWRSTDALVKGNTVAVSPGGGVTGIALDTHPVTGDAFTFGEVSCVGFGVLANDISDGTWVVANGVSVVSNCGILGIAEAVTTEDPLVLGVVDAVAVGIDNHDSWFTLLADNTVDVSAQSAGSAFAHELIVPLEAAAIQIGLSVANGIQVSASHEVEVAGNSVSAMSDATAAAVAIEELLTPEAISITSGQSQAIGIGVWGFPAGEAAPGAAAARGVDLSAVDSKLHLHAHHITITDNEVSNAAATTTVLSLAAGFETPTEAIGVAFSQAIGILANQVFDSVVENNTVGNVSATAAALASASSLGIAGHLPEPVLAVALGSSMDIGVIGSADTLVRGNSVAAGPSDIGISVRGSWMVLVDDNVSMHHKRGIKVAHSSDVAVERNVVSLNVVGVEVVNGWRIAVNFNNIAGNGTGLRYTIEPSSKGAPDAAFHEPSPPWAPPVDATYNWWGHITGPSGLGAGLGDSVQVKVVEPLSSADVGTASPVCAPCVVFSPWLTADAMAVLADGVGHLGFQRGWPMPTGWNTLATPVDLLNGPTPATDYDRLGNIITNSAAVQVAATFDAATQTWVLVDANYQLQPLDGVYVKLSEDSQARFIANTELTGPPSKALSKEWNLVGHAAPLVQFIVPDSEAGSVDGELVEVFGRATFFKAMGVRQVLVSVEVAGTTDVPGWNQALSPSINRDAWVFTFNQPGPQPFMRPFEAYWVHMENPDTLAGFSSTPVDLPPWAPDAD
jgi:hypothetical protein